jgi:acyl carrier protein
MANDVNRRLAALWSELLGSGEIAGDADFFDCGGTSVDAVHLAALIQENFEVSVDAIEVVVLRRFSEIAALISSRLAETTVA